MQFTADSEHNFNDAERLLQEDNEPRKTHHSGLSQNRRSPTVTWSKTPGEISIREKRRVALSRIA